MKLSVMRFLKIFSAFCGLIALAVIGDVVADGIGVAFNHNSVKDYAFYTLVAFGASLVLTVASLFLGRRK